MSPEIPMNKSENKEVIDDNARKFTVADSELNTLKEYSSTSYNLVTDWLELSDDSEKKLAYKEFENGEVQILLISKVSVDGSRTSTKEKITLEQYDEHLSSSILHVEKHRYELEYTQNDITFSIKLDEFAQSDLTVLEVDAATEDDRNAFDAVHFPIALTEVTGDLRYYGYRVADMI